MTEDADLHGITEDGFIQLEHILLAGTGDGTDRCEPRFLVVLWPETHRRLPASSETLRRRAQAIRSLAERYGWGAEVLDRLLATQGGVPPARQVTAHNGRPLTVKGHLIEKHVIHFARWYGTCGCFGEDGLEALHPLATAARIITRFPRSTEDGFGEDGLEAMHPLTTAARIIT